MGLIKNQNLDWRPSCDVITSPEVNVPSFLKVKGFLAVQKMSIPGFEPGNLRYSTKVPFKQGSSCKTDDWSKAGFGQMISTSNKID